MREKKYKINIHKGDYFKFWANCPELPGCIAEADTVEELMVSMKEAIEFYLEERARYDEPVIEEVRELVVQF